MNLQTKGAVLSVRGKMVLQNGDCSYQGQVFDLSRFDFIDQIDLILPNGVPVLTWRLSEPEPTIYRCDNCLAKLDEWYVVEVGVPYWPHTDLLCPRCVTALGTDLHPGAIWEVTSQGRVSEGQTPELPE